MDKETLRMQMLAGVITEGQYKEKLQENIYDLTSFHKGSHSTGRPDFNKMTADEIEDYLEKDKDNPGGLYGRSLSIVKHILDKKRKEETEKESLNEHYVAGGIVGIGAINQIPSRAKADYEDAFEHFLGQKYELKEEINEDEKPSKEELEKAIQQLMAIGWDRRDAENLVYRDMKEGKEVEEGKVNENMLAVGDNVRITAPLDADAETDEGTIAKVYPNFDSIPSEDIGYYEVDADAYDESALNSPWYKVDQDGEEMLYAAEELELN